MMRVENYGTIVDCTDKVYKDYQDHKTHDHPERAWEWLVNKGEDDTFNDARLVKKSNNSPVGEVTMNVGDVTSPERGSGARANEGKPEYAYIPARMLLDILEESELPPRS